MRLGDLHTLLAVRRTGSVTGAARELGVTPSQVSKAVVRLEAALKVRLLARSSRGVTLSEAGRRVMPHLEAVVHRLQLVGRTGGQVTSEVAVAAPSYLIQLLLPIIATCQPELQVRGLELAPALLRAYATENLFDMTILPLDDAERLPSTWVSARVGEMRKAVYGSPAAARRLGPAPVPADRLRTATFIAPIYNADGRFMPTDDDCPLPLSDRVIGHQAQTIALALELASRTDQLVFGPVIAARWHCGTGALVEIPIRGWDERTPLYLACNGDRVLSRVQTAAVKVLRETLSELEVSPTTEGNGHIPVGRAP